MKNLHGRRPPLLVLLPVVLVLAAVVQRVLPKAPSEDADATREAQALILRELQRETERDAITHAGTFVRRELLPRADSIQSLSVTHLKPHRYKVRALAAWTDATGTPHTKRVEADLQHGPTDKNWYLVDTEFLADAH